MKAEYVGDQEVRGHPGRGESGEGVEASGRGEAVYDRQDGGVTVGGGETGDEVHGNVRPEPRRNG